MWDFYQTCTHFDLFCLEWLKIRSIYVFSEVKLIQALNTTPGVRIWTQFLNPAQKQKHGMSRQTLIVKYYKDMIHIFGLLDE